MASNSLTPQQMQVALLIAEDLSNKEIAARLEISPKTVEFHKRNIYIHLGIHGPAALVLWLIRKGHLPL